MHQGFPCCLPAWVSLVLRLPTCATQTHATTDLMTLLTKPKCWLGSESLMTFRSKWVTVLTAHCRAFVLVMARKAGTSIFPCLSWHFFSFWDYFVFTHAWALSSDSPVVYLHTILTFLWACFQDTQGNPSVGMWLIFALAFLLGQQRFFCLDLLSSRLGANII